MLGGNDFNTVIGFRAAVAFGGAFSNATAIGYDARVNAPNKIRLGNTQVTVIEGQVAFTASSDKTQKENFKPVDGEEVLRKISGFELTSWNFIGHDPKQFRHYGPMAQDFFAAFGHDGLWTDRLGDDDQLWRQPKRKVSFLTKRFAIPHRKIGTFLIER